ncbi:MAG TPA: polysaccharide pyruvyl transferase family protein [Anaerolineaceae bacterium]|nr:polysaccharide pyruvyl transferase family protein [Anaerolineaceae bacterium]
MKQIAIAGEIYSSNIGDQAIHSCLAYLLKKTDALVDIVSVDISGRASRAALSTRLKPNQRLALLQSNPFLRPFFPALNFADDLIKRRKRLSTWQPALKQADLLVIGGGQLLMDNGLSFPLKLASIVKAAKAQGLPYTITACGVGKSWSAAATSLMRPILTEAEEITLRDPLSQERLGRFLAGIASKVTFDPSIWAAAVYPFSSDPVGTETIGLGVINRNEVNVHLERSQRFTSEGWLELWIDLVSDLLLTNHPVELFTTGSPVDYEFAEKLLITARERGLKRIILAPRPSNPEALILAFKKYGLVLAARLHAALLANAFGISSIGLAWDNKVKAYYGLTRRQDLCFELAGLHPSDVALACVANCGQPFPTAEIEEFKACSQEDARIILEKI